jgi:MerR family transcriptional regulator, light-induced transcriptional regulator
MGTRMLAIVKDMLKFVYNLNELSMSDLLEAAFEMYPVRVVCADIITPMMWEIGSMWERGEMMVVMEHFASSITI